MTTQTGESFDTAMQSAVDGTGTLSDGLAEAQANVVEALTAKGLSVSE
jgi:multiple sugar transport system substrate-binding protein